MHRRTVGSAHFLRQLVGSVFHSLGDMGDQDIAFDDADWSEDSNMGECDPGAPLTVQASSDRNPDHTHADFVFFCSTLLRCDLLAKKVPGRAPYSQHIIIRNWT